MPRSNHDSADSGIDALQPWALRTFPDAPWSVEFARRASEAQCILVGPGASGNALWDYQFVREKGLHEKLVILTPPDLRPLPPPSTNVRSRAVAVWERDKGRSLPRVDPKDWYELPAKLLAFGYAISSEHITAGAAIGFDQAGTPPCW